MQITWEVHLADKNAFFDNQVDEVTCTSVPPLPFPLTSSRAQPLGSLLYPPGINIVPEVVIEMFGVLGGGDRFPLVNELGQFHAIEGCPNNPRVSLGPSCPFY